MLKVVKIRLKNNIPNFGEQNEMKGPSFDDNVPLSRLISKKIKMLKVLMLVLLKHGRNILRKLTLRMCLYHLETML